MEKLTLSVVLVNQLLGYLGKRPYEESFQLITTIQAEDGIRDAQESRGLGDVYKRQECR